MPVNELLNKIKWSRKENPKDYLLFYYDRVENKLKEIGFEEILKVEEGFLSLRRGGKEVQIPLHRIKKVKKKGIIIWKR